MTGGHRHRGERADRLRADGSRVPPFRSDHQVLVVGSGLTAATCAGFLDQAGLDPALATPAEEASYPRDGPVMLWKPGLALLERLGLRRPVERHGVVLDRLERPAGGQTWARESSDPAALVALPSSSLDDILARQVRGRLRTTERSVCRVQSAQTGVSVTFEGGIEEAFDAVVSTTRAPVDDFPTPASSPTLHSWTVDRPGLDQPPAAPTESWARQVAAFVVPTPDGASATLVATPAATPSSPVDLPALESTFSSVVPWGDGAFEELSAGALQYRHVTQVAPAARRVGRVALAGPAVRPGLPGGLLEPALGVEDAWVLADALAYGPPVVDDALAAYETRRRRRERSIHDCVADVRPTATVSGTLSPLLRAVRGSRALAFEHITAGTLPAVARRVPGRL